MKALQDARFEAAIAEYGVALNRLARAYEFDPEVRRDLVQEIYFQLWRSLEHFHGRCSLRTWCFRVAHNVGASHVMRQKRGTRFLSLEELPEMGGAAQIEGMDDLMKLVHRLQPLERQIVVGYLEELSAAEIGEVTGLSAGNVATRFHRIKKLLSKQMQGGVSL